LKVASLPGYDQLLKIAHERSEPLLLEIGCGCKLSALLLTIKISGESLAVGHETRKMMVDGFPVKGIIASDISPGMVPYTVAVTS
jgi:hypothetical protein